MNVVLINSEYSSTTGLDHGGIATYTYAMANALAFAGHRVHVLCRWGTAIDPLVPGVELHRFGFLTPRWFVRLIDVFRQDNIRWELGCSRGACQIVREIHRLTPVDIVEIPEYNGLAAAIVEAFPVVIHLHTPSYLVERHNQVPIDRRRRRWHRFETSNITKAQAIVSPSQSLKEEICRTLNIVPERIAVIRHAIDTEPFDRIAPPPRTSSVINILFVGRLERRKGAEILVRAVPQLLALDSRIHLNFAGETMLGESLDYRKAIETSLTKQQRSRVWFLGPIPRAQLVSLYKQSNILLFPSIYENAPYTLLEAFAAKIPVVAADVDGVKELVRPEETAILFEREKVSHLIECIRTLIGNQQLQRRLSDNAYDYVKREHSPRRIVELTVDLYTSVRKKA